ncbi:hypothetical protein RFI_39135 [Reticulomyxa filosa]|uniref:Uncharacterized protein n=1 Tax=Reticulomyxa filosa TaxID=46433 RepID=X6LAM4_RETFI|nr:hypothetical protein RFI_39135 [Reticulomyxa filosa]|eukprot:ETN98375.1 hypothetical protein RFI_39135 [Reticulomyxa filosa]
MAQTVSTHELGTRAETYRVRTHISNLDLGQCYRGKLAMFYMFKPGNLDLGATKWRKKVHQEEKRRCGDTQSRKQVRQEEKKNVYVVQSGGEVVAKLRQHSGKQEEKDCEDEEKKKKWYVHIHLNLIFFKKITSQMALLSFVIELSFIPRNAQSRHLRAWTNFQYRAPMENSKRLWQFQAWYTKEGVKLRSICANEQGTLGRYENCANFDNAKIEHSCQNWSCAHIRNFGFWIMRILIGETFELVKHWTLIIVEERKRASCIFRVHRCKSCVHCQEVKDEEGKDVNMVKK